MVRARLADLPLRVKLFISFGLVFALLVSLTGLAYQTITANQEAADAVSHSLRVIGTAHETLTSLVDMETGYRGYLLTGRDEFLEPYRDGGETADQNLAELMELTADNPAQVGRWQELANRITEWKAAATEPGIALRRDVTNGQRDVNDLMAWVGSGIGKQRFDAMRQIIGEAITTEEQILNA